MHGQISALVSALGYQLSGQHGMHRNEHLGMAITERFKQGDLHHRLLDPRRRCQGTSNKNEELDIDHLLRSRGNLRRYHVDRLLRKNKTRGRRSCLLTLQSVHGLCFVLVGPHSGHVQLDMRCLRGDQRE